MSSFCFFLSLIFTWLNSVSSTSPPLSPSEKSFAVVGYLPEWRYLQWTISESKYRYDALSAHFTHLIIFSIEMTGSGELAALDRLPSQETLDRMHAARSKHGTKLLICFGGNSRTNGFPVMVASRRTRSRFLKHLVQLCEQYGFDGVDYNWEYPRTQDEWEGLFLLLKETREKFSKLLVTWQTRLSASTSDPPRPPPSLITLAYYPDSSQEQLLARGNAAQYVDLMHMMSYDQHGRHSTWEFGKASVDQGANLLPPQKLTMGLPFYARDTRTGDWTTYEDIVKKFSPKGGLSPTVDEVGSKYFNGAALIARKTKYALDRGLGGVMIWEAGQDCFDNQRAALCQGSLSEAISSVTQKQTGHEEL